MQNSRYNRLFSGLAGLGKVVLFLSFILWSLEMAHSFNMGHRALSFIICDGNDLKTISVDRNGNPVPHSHHCPSCVVPCVAIPPPQSSIQHRTAAFKVTHQRTTETKFLQNRPIGARHARAPPFSHL